jgi:MoaA/NifB/PqqE/SkfB family radical SAM enzyme
VQQPFRVPGVNVMISASYLPRVWMGTQFSSKLLPKSIRPLSAHIKLTENCQAKCVSCDYWKSRWQDHLDTDQAISLINQIGAAGIGALRLTGGEPLLRRDLFQVLGQADTSKLKRIILQTNGLLLKKLHREINDSPISHVCVSIDGIGETNDQIRGIRGYFDLGFEGMRLLRDKKIALSVTLNRISAHQLERLAQMAKDAGASVEVNILSRNLLFFKDANIDPMWPAAGEIDKIADFLQGTLKRPTYEVEFVKQYYNHKIAQEPPCVLGYLQVLVLSNGDVLTGCYPLKPVGNVLRESLEAILSSKAYADQCAAMVRRECPGCTCGVESSLAMKHAVSSGPLQIGGILGMGRKPSTPIAPIQEEARG